MVNYKPNMKLSNKRKVKDTLTNFLAAFFVIFGLSFAMVSFVQAVLLPESKASSNINDRAGTQEEEVIIRSAPERVVIAKIGVDQKIFNPSSADTAVLDNDLLKGVVRYPDSGLLGEKKNMFLLGHSTSYRVVQNQAFKAFNRLEELEGGDEILIMSQTEAHVYRVRSVKEAKASEVQVKFTPTRTLTLATCDTLGRKEDRFVVEADFIKSYKLSESN
jgi:LPXTG-site transpeptidase (sortase) family protein